ncbi:S41 family peptidase [Elizabethkingia ursingii]|uniref:Tail specific protease domain-containing protein n=1 Tax=Elizabethkingia ursingii TaxID=1756150 RepID=A0ABX3NDF0_9FLAO|nr:S41 family peptidase [Elizabethkingia ursingii]OPB94534.1 hypothetical protein BB021_18200 [Elizabethkingia ursingii]
MIHKRIIYLSSLLFFSHHADAQENTITRGQLVKDISYLKNVIERTPVSPFNKIPKNTFTNQLQKTKLELIKKKNISVFDMYLALQPLIAKLEDGHMELDCTEQFSKLNYFVFPFLFDTSDNNLSIKNIKQVYKGLISKEIVGKKIISINGFSTEKILDIFNTYTSGETKYRRLYMSNDYLNIYYNFLFNDTSNLEVNFQDGTSLKIALLKKMDARKLINEINENDKNKNLKTHIDRKYNYKIVDSKYALLTFNSFFDIKEFRVFLKQMFSEIKAKHIQNLIIDIRSNGGGNSLLGGELLSYFINKPFYQFNKAVLRYSEISKQDFLRSTENTDEQKLEYMNKKNGSTEIKDLSQELVSPKNKEEQYLGKVYLLTSPYTFSSATDFTNAFKYYKVGEIIGEETGGILISPGDVVTTYFPNSKLELSITTSKYYSVGAEEGDNRGVIPDHNIKADKALDYAIGLVK